MAKSKSQQLYDRSPEARAVKARYQRKFNRKPEQVAKRVELNRINRRSQAAGKTKVGDGKDYSHTIKAFEPESKNRGRIEKSRRRGSKRS